MNRYSQGHEAESPSQAAEPEHGSHDVKCRKVVQNDLRRGAEEGFDSVVVAPAFVIVVQLGMHLARLDLFLLLSIPEAAQQ